MAKAKAKKAKLTAAASQPIQVNPAGTTKGKYGSYSVGTISSNNNKYDKKAENALAKYAKAIPYTDPYADQIKTALGKVTNPDPYQSRWTDKINKYLGLMEQDYDPNSDANYLAYKNQYLAGGQKAMQDTLAQAAALTGGYGSSYGQSAAQQVYGDYTTALANKIPELAQAAYEMNMSRLNTYLGLDDTDYGRYRDTIGDNYNVLNALMGVSDSAYGRHQDTLGNMYNLYSGYSGLADRDYSRYKDEYGMWQDAVAALTPKSSGGGGGRSGSSRKSSSKSDYDLITELQYANKHGASVGQMLDYAKEELANGSKVVIPGTKTALPQGAGAEYVRQQLQHLLNQKKSYK